MSGQIAIGSTIQSFHESLKCCLQTAFLCYIADIKKHYGAYSAKIKPFST
jgi:hypothetical protein